MQENSICRGARNFPRTLGERTNIHPGQEVQIAVVVENSGLNQFKFVNTGLVDRDDLPNTAKFLTVTLDAGDSPFIIKSDPQMLGDLKASSTATGKFTVRIPADTPAGVYNLPVKLNYTYLQTAEQYGVDTVQNFYKSKEETFEFPVQGQTGCPDQHCLLKIQGPERRHRGIDYPRCQKHRARRREESNPYSRTERREPGSPDRRQAPISGISLPAGLQRQSSGHQYLTVPKPRPILSTSL